MQINSGRYQRQILLPEIGCVGQNRLRNSHVAIVGIGALGCPVAQALAAIGVGYLTLIDGDVVEISNLHRQMLYGPSDQGHYKVDIARSRLKFQNPDISIAVAKETLKDSNADLLLKQCDLVVDCTDSYRARYAINDFCVRTGLPMVSAAIHRFHAQVAILNVADAPCYRCLFPMEPDSTLTPDCAQAGVLGTVTAIAGSLQAQAVVRALLGLGDPPAGILFYDGLSGEFRQARVKRKPGCTCAGSRRRDWVSDWEVAVVELPPEAVLQTGLSNFSLLDVRDADEGTGDELSQSTVRIPLAELKGRARTLARDQNWLIVCASGQRSRLACEMLMELGFFKVYNLKGGLMRFRKSGSGENK